MSRWFMLTISERYLPYYEQSISEKCQISLKSLEKGEEQGENKSVII